MAASTTGPVAASRAPRTASQAMPKAVLVVTHRPATIRGTPIEVIGVRKWTRSKVPVRMTAAPVQDKTMTAVPRETRARAMSAVTLVPLLLLFVGFVDQAGEDEGAGEAEHDQGGRHDQLVGLPRQLDDQQHHGQQGGADELEADEALGRLAPAGQQGGRAEATDDQHQGDDPE